tara:strand:- start:46 stop:204 length:159 start_codon:yes stop_codon:yes gene_type:complete
MKNKKLKSTRIGIRLEFKPYLIGDIPPSFDKHDKNKWLWYNNKGITWIHKMD